MRTASPIRRGNTEISVFAHDGLDPLILANVNMIVLGNLAIVLERFLSCGLLLSRGEWDVADFEQLRRREENHVRRIVE